jgi:hypothetical protein
MKLLTPVREMKAELARRRIVKSPIIKSPLEQQVEAESQLGPPAPYGFEVWRLRKVLSFVLACSIVMTVACSTLNTLQLIVDSTAAAVPILQAAGVPIPPQVPTYIAAVANCIASVPGAPTPGQLLVISACLDKQLAPTLPPGIPQAVANIMALVIQDVTQYLAQNPAPVVGATTARKLPTKLSAGDVAKFEAMRMKAQETVKALRK